MKKEKRKHPRVPVGISMDIHAKGLPVSRCHGAIIDLSTGGMAIETGTLLEEGTSLYLKVNIPLEIRGEVRHMQHKSGRHRYGVRFHKINLGLGEEARPDRFIQAKFKK